MKTKLFILSILFLFSANTLFGADAEFRCWHGQQHALVLGTVTNVENAFYTIWVTEALPCVKLNDHHKWNDYNMLPTEQIPPEILVELKDPKYSLLSDSCRLGDRIVVSLIKKDKEPHPPVWQRMWHLLKVSGIEKECLQVICNDGHKPDAIAWAIFIRSEADKVVQGFGDSYLTFADGEQMETTKRIEEIYTISPSDFGTIDTDRYSLLSLLDGIASIAVIGGADGPTAVFVAKKSILPFIVFIVIVILLVTCLLLYWRKKKKNK
jgi:hypothetical protein